MGSGIYDAYRLTWLQTFITPDDHLVTHRDFAKYLNVFTGSYPGRDFHAFGLVAGVHDKHALPIGSEHQRISGYGEDFTVFIIVNCNPQCLPYWKHSALKIET